MIHQGESGIPRLEEPEIPGEEAEADGLVWSDAGGPDPADEGRALVPVGWVREAVRGALAQYHDDIVDAALDELRQRLGELGEPD